MGRVGAEQAGSRVWGALSPLGRRFEWRQWVQRNRVGRHQSESRRGRHVRKEADSASGKGVMWRFSTAQTLMAEFPTKQMGAKSPQGAYGLRRNALTIRPPCS